MATPGEHPYLPNLRSELRRGKIDRREFLRTATLLGVSAARPMRWPAWPTPARAQAELPKGGKIRIGMRVQEIKDPQTISWVEPSNVLRNTVAVPDPHRCQNNITHPDLLEKWEASEDLKTWTLTIPQGRQMAIRPPLHSRRRDLELQARLRPDDRLLDARADEGLYARGVRHGGTKDGKPVTTVRLWTDNAIEKVDDKTVRLNCKLAANRGARAPVPLSDVHARSCRKRRRQGRE